MFWWLYDYKITETGIKIILIGFIPICVIKKHNIKRAWVEKMSDVVFTTADMFNFKAIRLGNRFKSEFLALELDGVIGWHLYLTPSDPYNALAKLTGLGPLTGKRPIDNTPNSPGS